ncbi:hypothetical protein AVEN_179399-1 [Araneus ventricosus]|uniref:Uncharacterized protein n=1 Tax=Araneus ventricosus TaxID=182803 RepID=A0A4Y2BGR0_ARAVE|nr:hypothetical protein AVEN_179399-1 [Araneus ventricosus]
MKFQAAVSFFCGVHLCLLNRNRLVEKDVRASLANQRPSTHEPLKSLISNHTDHVTLLELVAVPHPSEIGWGETFLEYTCCLISPVESLIDVGTGF